SEMDLKSVTHKYLEDIAKEFSGNSHLGVFLDNTIIYVDRVVNSPRGYIFANIIGMTASAYSTGLGKALMAFQPKEVIENYLRTTTFKKYTPHTITDPKEIRENLRRVRERGYSFDIQESNEGVSCVGVPVFCDSDLPLCAISISVPHSKFLKNKNLIIKRMLEVARQISKELKRVGDCV
ncbi:MAG: IclR family transcriptional regulator, partial [Bacteroidales bacterium]|nr:IclR family transcriptional regulator [Bacteroidales bacterium]